MPSDGVQRLSDAVAGDAAANRIYLGRKGEHGLADVRRDEPFLQGSLVVHDALRRGRQWRNPASRTPSANSLLMWPIRWYCGPSNSSSVRPDER